MTDDSIISFGKYKGEKLANIPASYFIWMNKQDWCTKELKEYIRDNMDSFELEIKNEESKVEWKENLVKAEKNKPVYWNISQGIGKTRAAIQVYQGDKETLKEAKTNAEKITKAMNMHDKFLYLLEGFKDMHDYLKGANLVAYRDHFDMVEELLKEAKQKNKQ